jgi:hypothetical protein
MPFIGPIEIPEITTNGEFPFVTEFPHGRAQGPEIIVHQFGPEHANGKIEQRYVKGNGAKEFHVTLPVLTSAKRDSRLVLDFESGRVRPIHVSRPERRRQHNGLHVPLQGFEDYVRVAVRRYFELWRGSGRSRLDQSGIRGRYHGPLPGRCNRTRLSRTSPGRHSAGQDYALGRRGSDLPVRPPLHRQRRSIRSTAARKPVD